MRLVSNSAFHKVYRPLRLAPLTQALTSSAEGPVIHRRTAIHNPGARKTSDKLLYALSGCARV